MLHLFIKKGETMKYLLLLSMMLFSLQASSIKEFAQKHGYAQNYKEALALAKEADKPMMLVMVTHYCPWCRKFERATLSKKMIDDVVQKNFIPVILNREKGVFPKKFHTPMIPVVFFVDPKDEDGFWESAGYIKKKDYLLVMKEAIKLFKARR